LGRGNCFGTLRAGPEKKKTDLVTRHGAGGERKAPKMKSLWGAEAHGHNDFLVSGEERTGPGTHSVPSEKRHQQKVFKKRGGGGACKNTWGGKKG